MDQKPKPSVSTLPWSARVVRPPIRAGLTYACFLIVMWPALRTAYAQSNAVAAARAAFEYHVQTIEANHVADRLALARQYERELAAVARRAEQSEDSAALLEVKEAIARFAADRTVPEQEDAAASKALQSLQSAYGEKARGLSQKLASAMEELTGKYLARLESLLTQYDRANDIEAALAIKAEIARIAPPEQVTPARPALAQRNDAPPSRPSTARASSGYTVYAPGLRPPGRSDLVFATLPLQGTGNVPAQQHLVTVSAQRSVSTTRSDRGSSSYDSKRNTTKTSVVRLALRTSRVGLVVNDLTVVVKFFTKALNDDGAIDPTLRRSDTIPLSALSNAVVYVDCPEVYTAVSRTRRSTYSGGSTYRRSPYDGSPYDGSYRSGEELYGILVSVYGGDGILSFQGISAPGLRPLALEEADRGPR